jgi:alpha-galactosidase
MSMMSVAKDKSKALVFFSNLLKENNRSRYLKLQGLDKNKRYKNSYDGKTYSADYYMNIGLNFTKWLSEFSSHIIILEEEVGE